MNKFITQLMSGADNTTPAIGRWLGAILFLHMILIIPSIVVGALFLKSVGWEVWSAVFTALSLYVPSIVGSITVLIRVTDATEPHKFSDHG